MWKKARAFVGRASSSCSHDASRGPPEPVPEKHTNRSSDACTHVCSKPIATEKTLMPTPSEGGSGA